MLPPVRVWKILFKQNLKLCCYSGISPVLLRARDHQRAGAFGTNVVRELYSGCTTIWFLGAFARLPTSTTTTPDCSNYSATTTTTTTWLIRGPPTLSAIMSICFYLSSLFMCCSFYPFFMIPFYMHVQKLFFSSWYICMCVMFKPSIL
jgi:hypothetical protein